MLKSLSPVKITMPLFIISFFIFSNVLSLVFKTLLVNISVFSMKKFTKIS